jgi:transposase InsO family protein
MMGDYHVQFCERLMGKFHGSTLPVAESFFHTLKNELIYQCKFRTREEAKNVIFEYIEVFYNRIRAHSTNDYLSPVEYEELQKIA